MMRTAALVILVLVGLLAALLITARVMAPPVGHLDEYASVRLGDDEHLVESLASDNRFILIAQLNREDGDPVWVHHHVQGGPISRKLSQDEIDANGYLQTLGWTYPDSPTAYELWVLADSNTPYRDHIFYLIDEDGVVVAIYRGVT
ncbi:MAG: hypothetical protein WD009_09280 [Phycisphaeraceae bacterium]